jgi:hypothetical protein
MASLEGIIRLRKWELDEQRRALADLLEQRAHVENAIELLETEMLDQKKMAHQDFSTLTLGAYLEAARKKKAMLIEGLRKQDEKILEKQDLVSDAYRELKTYEVADENKQSRQRKKVATIEQNALDELGLQAFERFNAEDPD